MKANRPQLKPEDYGKITREKDKKGMSILSVLTGCALGLILGAILFIGACNAIFSCVVKFSFSSCSAPNYIPDKMGVTEGYYFYYGNERTLSDGTNRETLITSFVVNNNEISDFFIHDFYHKNEFIYFIFSDTERDYIVSYNVETKEQKFLFATDIPVTKFEAEKENHWIFSLDVSKNNYWVKEYFCISFLGEKLEKGEECEVFAQIAPSTFYAKTVGRYRYYTKSQRALDLYAVRFYHYLMRENLETGESECMFYESTDTAVPEFKIGYISEV